MFMSPRVNSSTEEKGEGEGGGGRKEEEREEEMTNEFRFGLGSHL